MCSPTLCQCGRLRVRGKTEGRALIRARLVLAEAGMKQAIRFPALRILCPCARGNTAWLPYSVTPEMVSLPRLPRPFLDFLGQPGLLTSHPLSFLGLPDSAWPPCLHRKLYFAQSHKPPFHGRLCVAPPGCLLSSSPDGPTKGFFYVPSDKGTCRGTSLRRLRGGLRSLGPPLSVDSDFLLQCPRPASLPPLASTLV